MIDRKIPEQGYNPKIINDLKKKRVHKHTYTHPDIYFLASS